MNYLEHIFENNKLSLNKPIDSDRIYYSELSDWYTENAIRSFSLKLVLDQSIHYKIGQKEYTINELEYMLACKDTNAKAYFTSKKITKSICIDICPKTFSEVFTVITTGEKDFENYLANYFTHPEFYESVHRVKDTALCNKLKGLIKIIQTNNNENISREWFLDLAEQIVFQEYENYAVLQNLNSIKSSTRKEILTRLKIAKDYIDQQFLSINEIKEIADVCILSEYHFFRCFKQAFHVTPFQYLTQKKMEWAKMEILKTEKRIQSIAFQCNFPDTFTFSKAFKRFFGCPPSSLRTTHQASRY